MSMITRIFQGLAWLLGGGLVILFYLAGAALFGATTSQPHRALGEGLAAAVLLLFAVALTARPGRPGVVAGLDINEYPAIKGHRLRVFGDGESDACLSPIGSPDRRAPSWPT